MMSSSVRCVVLVVVVAVASLVVGISFGKYLGQEIVGFANSPTYDSGWTNITAGEVRTFAHDLGTTDVLVYMMGKNPEGMIHQRRYGGDNIGGGLQGAYWFNLTESEVKVRRLRDDTTPDHKWEQIRVLIWRIPEPTT